MVTELKHCTRALSESACRNCVVITVRPLRKISLFFLTSAQPYDLIFVPRHNVGIGATGDTAAGRVTSGACHCRARQRRRPGCRKGGN